MKRIILAGVLVLALGCKKGNKRCGEDSGGFIPQYYRVFFKARDLGGGSITIEFKDADGNSHGVAERLSASWSAPGATCNTSSNVIRANFDIGEDYTWKAFDNTRTWNGSIPASCDANSCETIELK